MSQVSQTEHTSHQEIAERLRVRTISSDHIYNATLLGTADFERDLSKKRNVNKRGGAGEIGGNRRSQKEPIIVSPLLFGYKIKKKREAEG